MTRPALSLDLADARQIIAAGERKAIELGIPYNIAVADAGGGLAAHVRMDGAWLGRLEHLTCRPMTSRIWHKAGSRASGLIRPTTPGSSSSAAESPSNAVA